MLDITGNEPILTEMALEKNQFLQKWHWKRTNFDRKDPTLAYMALEKNQI